MRTHNIPYLCLTPKRGAMALATGTAIVAGLSSFAPVPRLDVAESIFTGTYAAVVTGALLVLA